MAGKKCYVVWRGRTPGVYSSWGECKAQVDGFAGAAYKGFESRGAALAAFAGPPPSFHTHRPKAATAQLPPNPPADRTDTVLPLPACVQANAIAVDAACSGNPGPMEYQGIDLATGERLFHFGPIRGTNNIGEFLAIVHALALIGQRGRNGCVVYSDSRNAMLWVAKGECKTKLARTAKTQQVFSLVERAEEWLRNHRPHARVVKWETKEWGEVPADFGRK